MCVLFTLQPPLLSSCPRLLAIPLSTSISFSSLLPPHLALFRLYLSCVLCIVLPHIVIPLSLPRLTSTSSVLPLLPHLPLIFSSLVIPPLSSSTFPSTLCFHRFSVFFLCSTCLHQIMITLLFPPHRPFFPLLVPQKTLNLLFFISFLLIFFLFMFLCVTCTLMFFQNFQMLLSFSLILSLMYFLRLVAPMLFSFLHVLPFSIFTYMYASASSSVTFSNLLNSLLPFLCQPSSLLCIFLKFILFFNTSLVPPLTDFLYTPSSSPLFFHLQHPARLPLNPEETGVLKLST